MSMQSLLRHSLLVLTFATMISAFPSSVGSCQAGISAINQGAHASVTQKDEGGKGLAHGGFQVWIDGERLYEDVVFKFTAGVQHTLQLVATGDIMRGFLMRIASTDGQSTKDVLQPTDIYKAEVPFFCDNVESVGGLGHVDSESKTLIEGTLFMPTTSSEMILDVTTVVSTEYSLRSGEWYYTPFKLQSVAPGTVFVNQPGSQSMTAPTQPVCQGNGGECTMDSHCCSSGRCIRGDTQDVYTTGKCVLAQNALTSAAPPLSFTEQDASDSEDVPQTLPVLAPVLAPKVQPVNVPVRTPVVQPVFVSVVAPVVQPVLLPVLAPVIQPVLQPVLAPVIQPVHVPFREPVPAPFVPPTRPVPASPEPTPLAGGDTMVTMPPSMSPVKTGHTKNEETNGRIVNTNNGVVQAPISMAPVISAPYSEGKSATIDKATSFSTSGALSWQRQPVVLLATVIAMVLIGC